MELLEAIRGHGFTAEIHQHPKKAERTVFKIRTSRGWTYQRFKSAEEVAAWAARHQPE